LIFWKENQKLVSGTSKRELFDFFILTPFFFRYLIPSLALVDPIVTQTMPSSVVACSGFDVISHAIGEFNSNNLFSHLIVLESYTARPYYTRQMPVSASKRPLHQGANPYADVGCLEALRISGKYFLRAVNDPSDDEAREQMLFAALLAGSCMGNSGTHLPVSFL
jgi:alcohol dehydrogenase class IV